MAFKVQSTQCSHNIRIRKVVLLSDGPSSYVKKRTLTWITTWFSCSFWRTNAAHDWIYLSEAGCKRARKEHLFSGSTVCDRVVARQRPLHQIPCFCCLRYDSIASVWTINKSFEGSMSVTISNASKKK